MTLGDFLTACGTADALITVSDGADVIARMSPATVGALSDDAKGYGVTEFTIISSKEMAVTVSTT